MKAELLNAEEPAEEISKVESHPASEARDLKAETDMWATEAIKHFDADYMRLFNKHTTVRGQVVMRNIADLKTVMEKSIHELLAQDMPDEIKRLLIKESIESYREKRDAQLGQLNID